MAFSDVITSHDFHLKNQPTVTAIPFTYAEPIPINFKIKTKYFSTITTNVEENIYEFEGLFKGYLTDGRPCVSLSCGDSENPGFFGIYSHVFGANIEVTSYVCHRKINDIPQPDDTYTGFNQDLRTGGTYLTETSIEVIECNMPVIFEDVEYALPDDPTEHYYTWLEWVADTSALTAPDLTRIFNWEDSIPEGTDFLFKCMYGTSTWTSNIQPAVTQIGWQGYRGTIIEGSVQLVRVPGVFDNKLVYEVVSDAVFYNLEKTTDGTSWSTAASLPDYLYREHENELGTFTYALTSEYSNPLDPGSPDEPENPTGDPDDGDDWGNVYTRSFFTQQYLCTEGAIQEISNALYDTTPGGFWEDIKKGLDMFGANPMDAVVNLTQYPLNLSTVFTNVSSSADIWFGGYKFTMQSHTASKLVYPDGFFYCGGVTIRPKFKGRKDAWRDIYATRLWIDLPYCGRYELDVAKYYGKFVKVIYYIDTHTGGCVACLVSDGSTSGRNGHCLDSFNGQIGTQVPITLTDFSAYANAQINTLLGGGGQAISQASGSITSGVSAAAIGSASGLVGAGLGVGVSAGLTGAKTVYGLEQNNINRFNHTRGGSSAMLNQYLNQKPQFIFEYRELDIPSNFYQMNGYPSNYSGTVGGFGGYLECDQVKLSITGATESEKEKIRSLLLSGIYI